MTSRWRLVGLTLPFLAMMLTGGESGCASSEPPHVSGLEGVLAIGSRDEVTRRLLAPSEDGFDTWKGAFASQSVRHAQRADSIGFLAPRTSDAPFSVGPGYVAPLRFTFEPRGARPSAGELHEGRVLYRDAYEGVDVVAIAKPFVAEEFLLVASPSSRHEFSWKVTLPSEVARVDRRHDGLWFLDRSGSFVLRMPAPYYLNREGTRYEAEYAFRDDEHELSISIPPREPSAYPLLVDPAFETRVWTELRAPYNFSQVLSAHDAKRKETVLFGDGRTWTWDGKAWTERVASRGQASPGYRSGASMTFDAKREHTLLFGGADVTGIPEGALWRWDGISWKHLSTNAGPEGKLRGALAYDRGSDVAVYFGGQTSFSDFTTWNTTWTWDGTSWTAVNPTTKPMARMEHCMAYDEARKRIVLFGGYGSMAPLDDTWEWQNQTWTRVTSADANPRPSARYAFSMAYDAARERVVLFGGLSTGTPLADTWTFDGTKWKHESPGVSPPGIVDAAVSYDPDAKRVLLVGGSTSTGPNNDLWSWDGTTWRLERLGSQPELRDTQPFLFEDTSRRELLSFTGGADESAFSKDDFAWANSGRDWTPRGFLPAPRRRIGSDMIFDQARGNVVLFGGNGTGLMQETWIFANESWSRVFPPKQPSARTHHALAYHAPSNQVVLFGGVDESGFPTDTWLWNGLTWTLAPSPNTPSGRTGHGMGFDPKSGKVLMVGGVASDGQPLDETWSWDTNGWVRLNPGGSPIQTAGGSMLLCNTSDCYLVTLGGHRYRYAPPNWEEMAAMSLPDLTADSTVRGVWDPGNGWFVVAARDTFFWKPNEDQFATDSTDFREGLVGWTGSAVFRVANRAGGGEGWGTFVRQNGVWKETATAKTFPVFNGGSTYDAARGEGVLVGRDSANVAHLWTWDGVAMKVRAEFPQNAAGTGAAMAFHPTAKTVMIIGDTSLRETMATWNGTVLAPWSAPPGTLVPPARTNGAAAYDPKSGAILLFGGGDIDGNILDDTWAWNGTSWSRLSPNQSPRPRSHHSMTYDAALGSILLTGGLDQKGLIDDAWTWNGSTWVPFVTKIPPPRRYQSALAHLSSAKRTILYGGASDIPGASIAFPWALYGRGGACTSDADCGTSACVDGVCCEATSCGTCQTCAGTDPGICTPVINDEDPDSCSLQNRVSCNQRGECGPALGGACKSGADCGSGQCVEGICCDSVCDRPCESCRADTKQSGKGDGRCGPAAIGKNPGGRCAGSATCSVTGVCAENATVSCRDGRYLVDFSGTETDCAPYRCAGKCLTRCSSVADCVFPSVCDGSGVCVAPPAAREDDSGCSVNVPRDRDVGGDALIIVSCMLGLASVRRRRGAVRREVP
ncbi:MAG: kelch repeat-containing protein [Polyangiaceae bacterium]